MPEALVIFLVSTVCLAVYVGAWLRWRDPVRLDPGGERLRVTHQVRALEERLQQARRERWDETMLGNLEAELAATRSALTRAGVSKQR